MKEPKESVRKLQQETIYKENILLAKQAGILGFSGASTLSVLSSGATGFFAISAVILLFVATFSFAIIVLEKIFVLHKGIDIHIGHIIISEDYSKHPYTIGLTSLLAGLAMFSGVISPICIPFVIFSAVMAFKYYLKFKKEFETMPDARNVPELME